MMQARMEIEKYTKILKNSSLVNSRNKENENFMQNRSLVTKNEH